MYRLTLKYQTDRYDEMEDTEQMFNLFCTFFDDSVILQECQLQKPTFVIAHNKTLVMQLYGEFKERFPENAVDYVTQYDKRYE